MKNQDREAAETVEVGRASPSLMAGRGTAVEAIRDVAACGVRDATAADDASEL